MVEDEAIFALDLVQQLRAMGHDVVGAVHKGEDALALAERHQPDLVLMDIKLAGDLDGISTAAQLRSRLGIPVVFVTAYTDPLTTARAKQARPLGYLLKPVRESDLKVTLEIALHEHQLDQQLEASRQLFSTALACVGDAVLVCDRFGRSSYVNAATEDLLGLTFEEIGVRKLTEFVNLGWGTSLDDALAGVASEPTLSVLSLASGRRVPVEFRVDPLLEDDGSKRGAVVVIRDVTPARRAELTSVALQTAVSFAEPDESLQSLLDGLARLAGATDGSIDAVVDGTSPHLLAYFGAPLRLPEDYRELFAAGETTIPERPRRLHDLQYFPLYRESGPVGLLAFRAPDEAAVPFQDLQLLAQVAALVCENFRRGHEGEHRKDRWERLLGRLVLAVGTGPLGALTDGFEGPLVPLGRLEQLRELLQALLGDFVLEARPTPPVDIRCQEFDEAVLELALKLREARLDPVVLRLSENELTCEGTPHTARWPVSK